MSRSLAWRLAPLMMLLYFQGACFSQESLVQTLRISYDGVHRPEVTGDREFKAGPFQIIYTNLFEKGTGVNLTKLADGYTFADYQKWMGTEPSSSHHPFWSTEINFWYSRPSDQKKVWIDIWYVSNLVKKGQTKLIWEGDLAPGLYHVGVATLSPYGAWTGAELTVN